MVLERMKPQIWFEDALYLQGEAVSFTYITKIRVNNNHRIPETCNQFSLQYVYKNLIGSIFQIMLENHLRLSEDSLLFFS